MCLRLNGAASVIIPRRIEPHALLQNPSARDIIHLDPHAGGILEQNGIVSRRPGPCFRRMDDLDVLLQQELVDLVDVFSTTAPKAQMMQADAALNEPLGCMCGAAATYTDCGASADIIDAVVAAEDPFQTQEREQRFIKRPTSFPLADR